MMTIHETKAVSVVWCGGQLSAVRSDTEAHG